MELIDQNEYERRANMVQQLLRQHPAQVKELPEQDRERLQRYFLGALKSPDVARYRNDQRKLDPTIEALGNQAYERLLTTLGLPASLPHRRQ